MTYGKVLCLKQWSKQSRLPTPATGENHFQPRGRVQAKGCSSQHPRTSDQVAHCIDLGQVRPNPANTEEHFQVRLTESKHCQVDLRNVFGYLASAAYCSYAAIPSRLQSLVKDWTCQKRWRNSTELQPDDSWKILGSKGCSAKPDWFKQHFSM